MSTNNNTNIIGSLLYTLALIFIIAWAIGTFAFNLGALIHILLVFAVISIILRIIRGN